MIGRASSMKRYLVVGSYIAGSDNLIGALHSVLPVCRTLVDKAYYVKNYSNNIIT